MQTSKTVFLITVAASVLLGAGAIASDIEQRPNSSSLAGPSMQTGVTVTQSAHLPGSLVPRATPEITGPAPLPLEEQGLPG